MFRRSFLRLIIPLVAMILACNFGAESTPVVPGSAELATHTVGPVESFPAASGEVYYVRPDGGSSEQCTGLADAPYPGSGEGQACAWDHPFRALPPGGTPRLAGGDTLMVAGGSYQMGFGAPGSDNCDESGSYDCLMSPIPSGPDSAHPTRILGAGWDSGCDRPPELWGSGRPWFIVNLTDASNVEMSCFEITDHSPCVEGHSGDLACERDTPPYGDWASYGLHAEDSANVLLSNLNIHGLAAGGVHAGRLTNWTVENVRIAGNGTVGWDGDLWDDGGDSNSGTLIFRHWLVEWNGCGETYPEGQPAGCWGQEAGGYGDGIGTGETGGDWIIEDSAFLHNTSDGLDLLYHTLGGSITLDRVHAEGNAGNQIKVAGQASITNSVLVGNCAFFENQPFTYWVDHCRALGATLLIALTGGEQISILNSTLYGQGDGLVGAGPREGFQCSGQETISARNSIFTGDADYFDSSDITFLFYQEGCADLKLDSDYNIAHNVKNFDCAAAGDYAASGAHDYCGDPLLAGPLSGSEYGMIPVPGSPAIDAGDNDAVPSVMTTDLVGTPRLVDGIVDIGAHEYQGSTSAMNSSALLPQKVSWQIQYAGEIDINQDVDVFNLDLFEIPESLIEDLHGRGVFVMCYFSAGSYEDWRPDAAQFPAEVLGNDMEGWPGEKWLDVRRVDLLAPTMEARLDLAVQKGCDGVDPDNVNGFENDTGFPLTGEDQLAFNRFLSSAAHQRGLLIGLKNDLNQIPDLVTYFDWILNEECFSYQECHLLQPFQDSGKPVFIIEYELAPEGFCSQANQMGFNALHKNWELDDYRVDCLQSFGQP